MKGTKTRKQPFSVSHSLRWDLETNTIRRNVLNYVNEGSRRRNACAMFACRSRWFQFIWFVCVSSLLLFFWVTGNSFLVRVINLIEIMHLMLCVPSSKRNGRLSKWFENWYKWRDKDRVREKRKKWWLWNEQHNKQIVK